MIYIVVAVHNRWDKTRQFLASLKKQTVQSFKVVLINDGSTDNTEEVLKSNYSEVEVLSGNGELWWTGSTRLGCDYVLNSYNDASYIIIANNDQIIAPDAIEKLVSYSKRYPATMIGSVSRDFSNHDVVYDSASRINWERFATSQVPIAEKGININDVDVLNGRFTLIPIEIFSLVNFDTIRFPHYLGDLDFFLQAQKKGYHAALCYESVCYDIGGPSGDASRSVVHGFKGYIHSQFAIDSHDNLPHRLRFILKNCPSPYWKFLNIMRRLIRFFSDLGSSIIHSIKFFCLSNTNNKKV